MGHVAHLQSCIGSMCESIVIYLVFNLLDCTKNNTKSYLFIQFLNCNISESTYICVFLFYYFVIPNLSTVVGGTVLRFGITI